MIELTLAEVAEAVAGHLIAADPAAVVTGPGAGTRSSRPGTPGQAAMPTAAIAGSTPTAASDASASSALATLCRPGSATAASTAPEGPTARKRCP